MRQTNKILIFHSIKIKHGLSLYPLFHFLIIFYFFPKNENTHLSHLSHFKNPFSPTLFAIHYKFNKKDKFETKQRKMKSESTRAKRFLVKAKCGSKLDRKKRCDNKKRYRKKEGDSFVF